MRDDRERDWFFTCESRTPSCRSFRFLPIEKCKEYEGFLSEWHFDPHISTRTHPELFEDEALAAAHDRIFSKMQTPADI